MRDPRWVEVARMRSEDPDPRGAEEITVVHVALLLGCAIVIYLACEWFTNAVEWLGVQLDVGPIAVGTILAAVGTALPESVVTLVAVTFGGGPNGADIGVGAAMGGPLVVATISYGTVGATLLVRRWALRRTASRVPCPQPVPAGRPPLDPDAELAAMPTHRLARDQQWFLAIFVVKVALGLVIFSIKPWLGVAFFAAYGVYFWRELRGGGAASPEELEPLKLQPRRVVPSRIAVLAQTLVALVVIFAASQVFVGELEWAGPALGLSPVVAALLISPIATELPETMNGLIWARQGKAHLALSNISGSMMIQATIPSGLGLLFTPWKFDTPLLLAGVVTAAAVFHLQVLLSRSLLTAGRLAAVAGLYGAFAVTLAIVI